MNDAPKPSHINTTPYPGFPTDVQAQWTAFMCCADGVSRTTDSIYPTRFGYVPEMARLGAQIEMVDSTAIITGGKALKGATVMSSDLRASASLVLAALVAEGTSEVLRVYHLDRGYERLEAKLAIARGERLAMRATRLMRHLGPALGVDHRKRLWNRIIERLRPQAAAYHQDAQRSGSRRIAHLGRRDGQDAGAHRVAGSFGPGQGPGKGLEHAIGNPREQPVGDAMAQAEAEPQGQPLPPGPAHGGDQSTPPRRRGPLGAGRATPAGRKDNHRGRLADQAILPERADAKLRPAC